MSVSTRAEGPSIGPVIIITFLPLLIFSFAIIARMDYSRSFGRFTAVYGGRLNSVVPLRSGKRMSSVMTRRQSGYNYGRPRVQLGTLIPSKMRIKMPYVTVVNLDTAGFAEEMFRLDSVYDPEVIAGGHQPRMMDQMVQWYLSYKVAGCRVRLMVANIVADSTPGSDMTLVGSAVVSTTSPVGDAVTIIEQPYTVGYLKNKWKMITRSTVQNPNNTYTRSQYFNVDSLRFTMYPDAMAAPQPGYLWTDVGSNPVTPIVFVVYRGDLTGSSPNQVQMPGFIKLTYTVDFQGPRQFGPS